MQLNPCRDAFRQLVREGEIKCIPNEARTFDYFATEHAAKLLEELGIGHHHGDHRQIFLGRRYHFGEHAYRLKWEGVDGLLSNVGNLDEVTRAADSIKVVDAAKSRVFQR